jgi:hypothetical protein
MSGDPYFMSTSSSLMSWYSVMLHWLQFTLAISIFPIKFLRLVNV